MRPSPLTKAALDLAWSHWSALGVRGIAVPPSTAVDPEALLYLTAVVAEHDPRLQAEVADWWHRYRHYLARGREKALAKLFAPSSTSKLLALEAAFTALPPTGKSQLDRLDTPARSLLRLRCAFGVNARAEVLLDLLTRDSKIDEGVTALALSNIGYSKRTIANVLDELLMAGILVSTAEGNRVRYRLADRASLAGMLGPLPASAGRWHLRLPILTSFVELADRLRGRDAVVQGIEARKKLEALKPLLAAAGIAMPAAVAIAETYWPELQRWLIETVIADDAAPRQRVPGMIDGAWVPPNAPRARRAAGAVLPRVAAGEEGAGDELVCLDLVQVPTVQPANDWMWAVLSTAATSTYAHSAGLDQREPWHFVTRRAGEERTFAVEYAEPIAHEQIARFYGAEVAARARADRPAVQLRLTRV